MLLHRPLKATSGPMFEGFLYRLFLCTHVVAGHSVPLSQSDGPGSA